MVFEEVTTVIVRVVIIRTAVTSCPYAFPLDVDRCNQGTTPYVSFRRDPSVAARIGIKKMGDRGSRMIRDERSVVNRLDICNHVFVGIISCQLVYVF